LLTATTDLINFIIVTCKIWRKIGLGHETSMAETETLAFRDRDVDNFRRDWDETLIHLETVSRPRRRDRDHNPGPRFALSQTAIFVDFGTQEVILGDSIIQM